MAEPQFTTGPQEHTDGIYRLFVANVPSSTTAEEFGAYIAQRHPVTHVELREPYTRRDGGTAPQTLAFVSFASEAAQEAALEELNGGTYLEFELRAEVAYSVADREHRRTERRTQRRRGDRGDRGGDGEGRYPADDDYEPPTISPTRAYVGNVSYDVTPEDFAQEFSVDGGTAELAVTRSSGRSLGYGIVVFENQEDRDAFVEQHNGTEHQGRELRVEAGHEPRPRRRRRRRPARDGGGRDGGGRDGGRRREGGGGGGGRPRGETSAVRAYVGNLPRGTTQEAVDELFRDCGGTGTMQFGEDGRALAYAYVDFESQDDRDSFVTDWDRFEHQGNQLRVEAALLRRRRRRRPRREQSQEDTAEVTAPA